MRMVSRVRKAVSVTNHVVLDINPKMYTEEQQTALAEAFRDHGFDVREANSARFSATEVANAIILVIAEESTRQSFEYAAKYLHDRWLRSILAATIFRPFTHKADVALTVDNGNSSVTVITEDEYGLDQAYSLLADVTAVVDAHGHSDALKLLYRDGSWYIQTRADRSIYRYDDNVKSLARVAETDVVTALLNP